MPNSAVMIGRPIASTDPNASSRMMMAAIRPTNRPPRRRELGLGDDRPSEADLEACGLRGRPEVLHLGDLGLGNLGPDGRLDGGIRGLRVTGHCGRPALRIGALDPLYEGKRGNFVEQPLRRVCCTAESMVAPASA